MPLGDKGELDVRATEWNRRQGLLGGTVVAVDKSFKASRPEVVTSKEHDRRRLAAFDCGDSMHKQVDP
jgi:hypothetical protein